MNNKEFINWGETFETFTPFAGHYFLQTTIPLLKGMINIMTTWPPLRFFKVITVIETVYVSIFVNYGEFIYKG